MPLIAALILAGGTATRLGGVDKPLLPLGGRSVIGHVIARLTAQTANIAISANGDPRRYAHLALPILPDAMIGRGPLGGVLRGLHWAAQHGATHLLSVPGDTPFIPTDLLARLGEAPSCAENAAGLHPLVALWPVECRTRLADWLETQPSFRVRSFTTLIGMRHVPFDDTPDPFLNINTPADLLHAQTRLPP